MNESIADVINDLAEHGHGQVVPNVSGPRGRCGGPVLCDECQRDQDRLDAAIRSCDDADEVRAAYGRLCGVSWQDSGGYLPPGVRYAVVDSAGTVTRYLTGGEAPADWYSKIRNGPVKAGTDGDPLYTPSKSS